MLHEACFLGGSRTKRLLDEAKNINVCKVISYRLARAKDFLI